MYTANTLTAAAPIPVVLLQIFVVHREDGGEHDVIRLEVRDDDQVCPEGDQQLLLLLWIH